MSHVAHKHGNEIGLSVKELSKLMQQAATFADLVANHPK